MENRPILHRQHGVTTDPIEEISAQLFLPPTQPDARHAIPIHWNSSMDGEAETPPPDPPQSIFDYETEEEEEDEDTRARLLEWMKHPEDPTPEEEGDEEMEGKGEATAPPELEGEAEVEDLIPVPAAVLEEGETAPPDLEGMVPVQEATAAPTKREDDLIAQVYAKELFRQIMYYQTLKCWACRVGYKIPWTLEAIEKEDHSCFISAKDAFKKYGKRFWPSIPNHAILRDLLLDKIRDSELERDGWTWEKPHDQDFFLNTPDDGFLRVDLDKFKKTWIEAFTKEIQIWNG
jgi:hypothetical protein